MDMKGGSMGMKGGAHGHEGGGPWRGERPTSTH